MTTLRTAAQQALEALETNNQAWKNLADSGDAGFWEAEEQPFYETSVKAITALRAALAEPVQEPVAWKDKIYETLYHQNFGNSIPLYTATPQRKPPIADEALWEMWVDSPSDVLAFARRIEMWHGIT